VRRVRFRLVTASAIAVAVAASGCSRSEPDVTVRMVNYTFKPTVDVVISQGDSVGFVNETSTVHNITLLHGTHLSLDVPADTTVTTTKLGALKPGTYFFRCKYHYRQGMVGVLTVHAAGAGS
jgi:plastocyanin